MQGPYPDILFHFTNATGLKGILATGFQIKYAREKITNKGSERKFGVPMTSFCDLRLSELPFHMNKYGKFGIGLSKQWAIQNGLNPVAYVTAESEFTNLLLEGLQTYFVHVNTLEDLESLPTLSKSYMNLMNVQRYIKNYEGRLERGSKVIDPYRFADEREWRYVLPHNTPSVFPFVSESQIATSAQKNAYNKIIENKRLEFNTSDVRYLIVPKEANIRPLRQHINSLLHLSEGEKEHLIARILTADQIASDM